MGGDKDEGGDQPKKRSRPDVAERCKQKKSLVETCVKACLRRSTIGSNQFKDKIQSKSHAEDQEELIVASACCEKVEGHDNANLAKSVVKMKLATFCPDVDVRRKIESIVRDMNVLVGEAYALANFHVLRKLASGCAPEELPKIDRNFYYRCLVGLADANTRKDTIPLDLATSITAFEDLKPKGSSKCINIKELNQVVATTSVTMATMATNHLWTNLVRRIQSYLSWKHPDLKNQIRRVIDAVVYKPKAKLEKVFAPDKNASSCVIDKLQRARAVAEELRGVMQLPNGAQFASNAHLTLPLYYKMLKETVARKRDDKKAGKPGKPKRMRTFTILPAKSGYTTSYVQFSTMAFLGILKRLKRVNFVGDARSMSTKEQKAAWAKVCNLRLVETFEVSRHGAERVTLPRRIFDQQITTDGCAVSILMSHKVCLTCPRQSEDALLLAQELFACNGDVDACGVDPGFTDVVTVFTRKGEVKSYSSAKYYEMAKYNMSRRRTDRWNLETAEARDMPSNETADVDQYADFLKAYLAVLPMLVRHRMDRGYRNMRFLRYCQKKKMVHEICDTIAPRDSKMTIVGFGDWNGGSGTPISRRTCGPLQEIKMELRSRANVVFLDVKETKTSVTCNACFGRLVNMKAPLTVRVNRRTKEIRELTNQRVHKVLHCQSNECRKSHAHTTWNRDVNASKNILMLTMLMLKSKDRPLAFCHGT